MRRKVKAVWTPSFLGGQGKDGKFGIYSAQTVKGILQYERSRADREGGVFCLVLFRCEGGLVAIQRLAAVLKKGTRLIDHLGWYDDTTVCAILTSTDRESAELFEKKIRSLVEVEHPNGTRPQYVSEVVRYPNVTPSCEEDAATCDEKIYQKNKLHVEKQLLNRFSKGMPFWKRVLDITGAVFGLTLLFPLFALVMLHIKRVSPGPVFYKSQRVGLNGKCFTFLKFRSMHAENNESFHANHATAFINNSDVPMVKLDAGDPRIIPGGKFLRKTCIDELPQLINVLKGEMSLVGPRPCIPYEAEEYLRWHTHRFDIVPGMTGLWQVSGKNSLSFREMIALDILYSRKMSLFFDLRIILMTFPAIFAMVFEKVGNKIARGKQAYT